MRQELETMVEQKEAESAEAGENAGRGRTPALFMTCTTAPYKWQQLHNKILQSLPPMHRQQYTAWQAETDETQREIERKRCYWQAAVDNPAIVAWYSAWRLEAQLKAIIASLNAAIQSKAVPDLAAAKALLERQFAESLGTAHADFVLHQPDDWGTVDDYWATYEWSEGGLIHLHIALWIVGSPRIDVVKIAQASDAPGAGDDNGMTEEENTQPNQRCTHKEFYYEDEAEVFLEDENLNCLSSILHDVLWFYPSMLFVLR